MPEVEGIFHQVAALLLISAVIAVIAARLRQPLIVGFIGAGILVGPEVLGLVDDPEEIELFAKIGIALLLFVVGLKLDVRLIRVVGPVALATGLGQVFFTSAGLNTLPPPYGNVRVRGIDVFQVARGGTLVRLGGASVGWMLAVHGFTPLVAQTEETLTGIRLLMSFYPAVFGFVGGLIMLYYPLRGKLMVQIEDDLAARRGNVE
jgi:hypothetical protein